jgi:hypothetical protein
MDHMFALQKDFTGGEGTYAHGSAMAFADWMDWHHPTVHQLPLGKAGHGTRFDAWLECSHAVLLMTPYMLEFLQSKIMASTATLLDLSCYYRLSTSQFESAYIAATVAWEILFCDLRYFTATVLSGWHVYDMARIADAIDAFYQYFTDDNADVSMLLDIDYHVLSDKMFPELIEFRESRQGERIAAIHSIISKNKSSESGKVTMRLLKAFIGGCNANFLRNCSQWVTRLEGTFSWPTWTEERKDRAKGSPLHTIELCESVFGCYKYSHKLFVNAKLSTVAGITAAKINGTFEGVEGVVGGPEIVSALLATVKLHGPKYDKWAKQDEAAHKKHRQEQLDAAVTKAWNTKIARQRDIYGYHHLQRIQSKEELHQVLSSADYFPVERRKSRRKLLLTTLVKALTIGFGMTEHVQPFSSKKDPRVGTEEELIERLENLLDVVNRDKSILRRGPQLLHYDIEEIEGFEDMNDAVTELNKLRRNKFSDDVCDLAGLYSPTLKRPWIDVGLATWKPFTSLQAECRTHRIFVEDDGKQYMCDGIEWIHQENDYIMYFHEYNANSSRGRNKVERLSDERVDFAYFKSDIDEETEEGYYGVADWNFTWDE